MTDRIELSGTDAIEFAERLEAWRGDVAGDAQRAFHRTGALEPSLTVEGRRLEVAFQVAGDDASEHGLHRGDNDQVDRANSVGSHRGHRGSLLHRVVPGFQDSELHFDFLTDAAGAEGERIGDPTNHRGVERGEDGKALSRARCARSDHAREEGGFVVMELLKGETLDETVERGVLTQDDFVEVVTQTMEALIAAQASNVAARDGFHEPQ